MSDPTLPDGVNSADLSTAAEIIREERICSNCGSDVTVDVTRIERAFDFQDEWTCPVCNTHHTDEDDYEDGDPDSYHDAMREDD